MIASRRLGSRRHRSTSERAPVRGGIALVLGSLLGLGLACSQSSEPGPAPGAPDFCAATYGTRCGVPCADDTTCGGGLFCSYGACTAECTAASGCGAGLACGPLGRCVNPSPPPPPPPPLPTAPPTSTVPMSCPKDITVTFTRETPDVVFVIDQSASMLCPMNLDAPCEIAPTPPPQLTRWEALRQALLSATGPIAKLQAQVNFGMLLYSEEEDDAGTCPDFTEVAVAPNNYETIKAKYLSEKTKNATPTAEALHQAVTLLSKPPPAGQKPNPKYVILATDGNPNNCFVPFTPTDPEIAAEMRKAVEDEARAGHNVSGVTTLVIAVGKGLIDPTHLQNLALAGGEGLPPVATPPAPGTEKYYEVGNNDELIATFDEVTKGVRSCVIELDATVDPNDASKGNVTLDGQPVTYGDTNGWRLVAPNDKIEFVGTACAKVKAPATQIAVTFQCGSNVIPKPPR